MRKLKVGSQVRVYGVIQYQGDTSNCCSTFLEGASAKVVDIITPDTEVLVVIEGTDEEGSAHPMQLRFANNRNAHIRRTRKGIKDSKKSNRKQLEFDLTYRHYDADGIVIPLHNDKRK